MLTRVSTNIPPRDDGSGSEACLLHLAKYVLHVLIQGDLPKLPQRRGTGRPSSGWVKYIHWKGGHVSRFDDLGVHIPRRIFFFCNFVVQVPSEGVRVLAGKCLGLFLREVFNALIGENVDSDIDKGLRYHLGQLCFDEVCGDLHFELTLSVTNLYALTPKISEWRYDFGVPQSLKINMRVLKVSGLLLMKLYGGTGQMKNKGIVKCRGSSNVLPKLIRFS